MRPYWGDDYGIACCVSAMRLGKQMQFFGARVNLAKALLYAINGGRDEMSGQQIAPPSPQVTGDVLDFDEVWTKFDATMEWLARTYVHAMNCIHYMHDKDFYERLEMALQTTVTFFVPWHLVSPGYQWWQTVYRLYATRRCMSYATPMVSRWIIVSRASSQPSAMPTRRWTTSQRIWFRAS